MPLFSPVHTHRSWRALAHRNYRLFFSGQAISLIGTWMTRLASSWFVYRLTYDPFLLGLVNFASLVPTFLLSPFAGVWVDRSLDLRRLIIITQFAAMLQSFALAAASLPHVSTSWAIGLLVALNAVQGVINAFDMPARQAFLPRMIPANEDLANGIALNSTLFNAARLLGPAVAGVLIGLVGETWCFILDGISYVAVLWALYAIQVPAEAPRVDRERQRLFRSFLDGVRYAYGDLPIRAALLLVAVLSFMGLPYTVLLPIYAKEVFGGGPYMLGLLTSAAGLGALVGALRLAARESVAGIGRLIVMAGAFFAVALAAFAYSRSLPLSLVLLFITGYGMITQSASCNTILQTVVSPDKRGRVMSLYATAFVGMSPFGSLMAGFLAKNIGTPQTLGLCATSCALSTAFFAWRLPQMRAAARQKAS